jgi:hypothetical protein
MFVNTLSQDAMNFGLVFASVFGEESLEVSHDVEGG